MLYVQLEKLDKDILIPVNTIAQNFSAETDSSVIIISIYNSDLYNLKQLYSLFENNHIKNIKIYNEQQCLLGILHGSELSHIMTTIEDTPIMNPNVPYQITDIIIESAILEE